MTELVTFPKIVFHGSGRFSGFPRHRNPLQNDFGGPLKRALLPRATVTLFSLSKWKNHTEALQKVAPKRVRQGSKIVFPS